MTIWFTADHHFGHENIIKYCNRPFLSASVMDETMIDRWNSVVETGDAVYHLGDFTLGDMSYFRRYSRRLNGRLFVIPGSHDWRWLKGYDREEDPPVSADGMWVTVTPPLMSLEIREHRGRNYQRDKHPLVIVLCHYSMQKWDRSHHGSLHLFGHSHGRVEGIGRSMDVGVDCWDFYPLDLDAVIEELTEHEDAEMNDGYKERDA